MNPNLAKLQSYPFEKLRLLFKDITPNPRYTAINLGIGEPKRPTPEFIRRALTQNLSGLARYPATAGTPALREAIAAWATKHMWRKTAGRWKIQLVLRGHRQTRESKDPRQDQYQRTAPG